MKKWMMALMAVLFLGATSGLALAQDTGGDKAATTGKKGAKISKAHHKGGKKSKKGSSGSTTPPPK